MDHGDGDDASGGQCCVSSMAMVKPVSRPLPSGSDKARDDLNGIGRHPTAAHPRRRTCLAHDHGFNQSLLRTTTVFYVLRGGRDAGSSTLAAAETIHVS